MVWSLALLRTYLGGVRFTVRTENHDGLRVIFNMADAMGKLARWRLRLSEMEFSDIKRPSMKHVTADALSHLKTAGEDTIPMHDALTVFVTILADAEDSDEERILYAESKPTKDRGAN